ncbi:hypothetical protein CQA53_02105 [Helicobacter didelphidarum]|uniref:RDD family protein n=2 Tax=Helicobacter didelphidarum TaxID=2040648 RepID=A0A3D8IRE0_9HELI|nr:hypothetical protein CQA53_02105 [Helicobacter didelphidarum]
MQKIIQSNFLMARLKAFITDMFLLNMPLLYFTTYIVLDGKDEFLHNNIAIGLCEMSYCGILIFFFYFTGQSPGFRYAEIMLCQTRIQKSAQDIIKMQPKKFLKPSLLQTCIYVIVWLIELSFFLWIFSFMRKDKRTLHEILSHTQIIYKENRGVKS